MQPSHSGIIKRYDSLRDEARRIAEDSLPKRLKTLKLDAVDARAVTAFRVWQYDPERKVDWDWDFASRKCVRYPKAFDLSLWFGSR